MFTARITHPNHDEIGLIPVTQVRASYPSPGSSSAKPAPGFPRSVSLVRADGHNCIVERGTVEILNASGTLLETFYPNIDLPEFMPD